MAIPNTSSGGAKLPGLDGKPNHGAAGKAKQIPGRLPVPVAAAKRGGK